MEKNSTDTSVKAITALSKSQLKALIGANNMIFENTFSDKRVLITGHTGFKGGWLSLWLKNLGAEVYGISLEPDTSPNFFELVSLEGDLNHHIQDIRDFEGLNRLLLNIKPEIVFHLAAQPLVRRSYSSPKETFETNVLGTVYLLEALRNIEEIEAVLCITSDKVYENKEQDILYTESDTLGGKDPYSASKSAAEMIISGYRTIFSNGEKPKLLVTARGGNVIGGGDWGEDRLIPDVIRSFDQKNSLVIRNPQSVRPWQHVLCLCHGYLQLMHEIIFSDKLLMPAWNFGPTRQDTVTVSELLEIFDEYWELPNVICQPVKDKPESNILMLSSEQARVELNWNPAWDLRTGIQKTAEWYRDSSEKRNMREVSLQQLNEYISDIPRL